MLKVGLLLFLELSPCKNSTTQLLNVCFHVHYQLLPLQVENQNSKLVLEFEKYKNTEIYGGNAKNALFRVFRKNSFLVGEQKSRVRYAE